MKTLILLLSFSLFWGYETRAQWQTKQSADFVIGQPNLHTKLAERVATSRTFLDPYDVAIDLAHGKLYVSDVSGHRVLRFAYPITENFPAAEIVFGQPDFDSTGIHSVSPTSLYFPLGLFVDNQGSLWVCDEGNNRVVRYDAAYLITTNNPPATGVVGQASLVSNLIPSIVDPNDVVTDNLSHIYVADFQRVLRFDGPTLSPVFPTATMAFGAPDVFSFESGDGPANFDSAIPYLDLVNDTLYVDDYGNRRICYFSNASLQNNQPNATGIFQVQAPINTIETTLSPNTLVANTSKLYVCTGDQSRIYWFDKDFLSKGADTILQGNDYLGGSFIEKDTTTWKNSFASAWSIAVDEQNQRLIATDVELRRLLVFSKKSGSTAVHPKNNKDLSISIENNSARIILPTAATNSTMTLVDLSGRIVFQSRLLPGENSIPLGNFTKGLYLLNTISDKESFCQKISIL